jgi:hypothetical protein
MTTGPGKYDDLATLVREKANARGVVVIIIGGDKGMGFSVQGDEGVTVALPSLLDHMARKIRDDIRKMGLDNS